MGRIRLGILVVLLILVVSAILLTVRQWAAAGLAEVKDVPTGHQEIAWISPATSGDGWERLVAALGMLQRAADAGVPSVNSPQAAAKRGAPALPPGRALRVDLANAFLPLTADVPEVALYFADAPNVKLWIRWYKLSGENPSPRWFEKLSRRGRPPLAVIGGETSGRALYQSRALQECRTRWQGPAPLYFISTATAERYYPSDFSTGDIDYRTWPKLMEVYEHRTFRFCFTNARIVEAVLDFVHQNPQVCAQRLTDPQLFAGLVGLANAFGSLGMLHASGHFQPFFLSTLAWADDSYSRDLYEIFLQVFADQAHAKSGPFTDFYNSYIDYSVGSFLEPNPREALAVGLFLAKNPSFRDHPQLLALPAGTQPARRFLRALCRRAPMEIRNVVVVTGDAIAFNNIYRDRDVVWNIQDMPVPLVFFSHRNPVDAGAGFAAPDTVGASQTANTGTQDVLLQRDIFEALALAAFDGDHLVADADQLLQRLRHTRWSKGRVRNDLVAGTAPPGVPFFDAVGNRQPGTGEHVIWLRPVFDGNRNLPEAFISVWRAGGDYPERTWRAVRSPLHVLYGRPSQENGNVHGEN